MTDEDDAAAIWAEARARARVEIRSRTRRARRISAWWYWRPWRRTTYSPAFLDHLQELADEAFAHPERWVPMDDAFWESLDDDREGDK